MNFPCLFLAFLAISTLFSGCSMSAMALRSTVPLMEQGARAYDEESDVALAREALTAQLKFVEALLQSEPDNPSLLLLVSRGYAGYAFLFLEDSQPERAKVFYRRGRDYGLRLVGRRLGVKDPASSTSDELDAALKRASRADVPALFWAAYAWAGGINLARDSAESIADLPKAVAMMERAHALDPKYYFAGTDLFFGAYFASRPKMLGGDPEKSKSHFEWAKRINEGKFLLGYVLEARYYAVAAQDEDLYKSLLKKAMELPSGALPGARLADEVAKQKAKSLLGKTNEYF